FPIQMASVDYRLNDTGDDWAVFMPGRNSNGETVFDVQQAAVKLGKAAVGDRICKWGYGVVGLQTADPFTTFCQCDPNLKNVRQRLNKVQTKSCGEVLDIRAGDPNLKSNAIALIHDLDTCGGDSGGLITLEDDSTMAVAIHTGGVCRDTSKANEA